MDPDLSRTPEASLGGTREGEILGTPAYMSPEQARGLVVDKRTDIWAFGCVVYEMLTGRLAFAGPTLSDTIAAILEREPDWARVPADLPASIPTLLRLCLEKDLKKRRRDAGDVRIDIERALAEPIGTMTAATLTRDARLAWMAALAVAVALIVGLSIPAVRNLREAPPADVPEMRTEIVTPTAQNPFFFAGQAPIHPRFPRGRAPSVEGYGPGARAEDTRPRARAELAPVDKGLEDILLDIEVVVDDRSHLLTKLGEVLDSLLHTVIGDVVGGGLGAQSDMVADVLLGKAMTVVGANDGVGQVEILDHGLELAPVAFGHPTAKDHGEFQHRYRNRHSKSAVFCDFCFGPVGAIASR